MQRTQDELGSLAPLGAQHLAATEATDIQSVSVDFTQLDDAAPVAPGPPKCSKNKHFSRRMKLLEVTTLHSKPPPCIECGAAHDEKTLQDSVSSLPARKQNALRARVWWICGVFLAIVALTTKFMLSVTPSVLPDHKQTVIIVSLVVVCVLVVAINDYELATTPWLAIIVLGIAQAGIIAGIESANDSHTLLVICCAMSFNFMFVAVYLRLASKRATDEDRKPLSPVTASTVAYVLSAATQIAVYAASGAAAIVSRNELITCLVVEMLLVVYLLWDLSQLWRVMAESEVPRVLGSLYVDLLVVGMFFVIMVVVVAAVVVFCTISCLRCLSGSNKKESSNHASDNNAAGSTDAAAGETKSVQTLKVAALGDAFYKKMLGA